MESLIIAILGAVAMSILHYSVGLFRSWDYEQIAVFNMGLTVLQYFIRK